MRLVIFIVVFLFCIVQRANAFRYALLAGQNDGGKGLTRLKYAHKDVERFSELLVEIGGFDKSNVITISGADSSDLEAGFDKIKKLIQRDNNLQNSLFLFYYSGHADEKSLLLGKTTLSLEKIENRLQTVSSAIKIGIFDACQSGVVTAFKGGGRAEPFYFKEQQKVKGKAIIASSSANERAQESEALKGSVFSFHWMNGLRGSADLSYDRKVTLNEAYQYAYRKTVETSALTSGMVQHPVYRFNIKGQGDIILTNLQDKSGGILLDSFSNGKFLILSENYMDVYADFYKAKGKAHFISLPSGTYTLINAKGKDIGTCVFSVEKNRTCNFFESMLIPNTRIESTIKGKVAENKAESEIQALPLSRFRLGFGCGVHAEINQAKNDHSKDLSIEVAGSYHISEKIDFFSDLYCLFFEKRSGIDFGFDYIRKIEDHRLRIGLGTGVEYLFGKGLTGDALEPFFLLKPGFEFKLNERIKAGLGLPYKIIFGPSVSHRAGLELQIMLSGKYSDVKVIK